VKDPLEQLKLVATAERILLLPHCLRQSNSCKAKYDQTGLQCAACNANCPVNLLTSAAREEGYKGVCVAPGGRMAVNFIKEKQPGAIVAVACQKELEEGLQAVKSLSSEGLKPKIVIIPLSRDGCLDTQVDVENAIEIIRTPCFEMAGQRRSSSR
jgi:geranylgeranyl diphosphate synthase, type II